MSTKGYLVIYIAVAIWVFLDAKKRLINGLPWAICTAIFGPLVVPIYLAKRPLKDGELREGGLAWNVLKNFALFWTLTIVGGGLVGMVGAADAAKGASTDLEKAGAGCGMVMGVGLLAALWFFPMVSAIVLGVFLKKSTIVEKGPTGPLASNLQSGATTL
jgi:hypothetical protein